MDMIRKIHRQFLLIATAAIFLIVAAALGIINGSLYLAVRDEIRSVTEYIVSNGGVLNPQERPLTDSWFDDGGWMNDTPEFSYQTRYFSVLFGRDGTAKAINVNHIAAFTPEEAAETAAQAAREGTEEGFFKKDKTSYAYRIAAADDGLLVVILDCTRDMAAVNAFLRYSLMFGLLSILIFVLIVTVLSKRAIRPFQENLENQKRFITNAGHELKTPIAIISANAEAMELISGKNEWTENILKQVARLSKLISDLITLAKVGEASPKDVRLVKVDLTACTEAGVRAFLPVITEQGRKAETRIAPVVSALADARMYGELVNILLDNAAKYCDAGGTVTVTLAPGKKGKGAALSVSNDYKEGAHADYSRFFERFYRGDTSHSSGCEGYGIGLSMAQDMVKLMRGKIRVSWADGVITFSVELGAA